MTVRYCRRFEMNERDGLLINILSFQNSARSYPQLLRVGSCDEFCGNDKKPDIHMYVQNLAS